ncbi:MAG: leucine-rich repeat protein [Clostridiales bacterium]|jgi:predicted phosphodiesterase|nr:leucine-rich repeat protein [Clostridiales bacterium]
MIYVMSDIHGCFNTFQNMLKRIEFKESDQLFILGDVIDRGLHGVMILKFIIAHENIVMLMGNHEYMMIDMLRHDGEWHKQKLSLWTDDNKGKSTYDALFSLPENEREAILDFVENLDFEKTVDVGETRYLLVHGRPNMTDDERKAAERRYSSLSSPYYGRTEQVWGHFLPYAIKRPEKVIFGHTITPRYTDWYPGRIFRRNGNIGIDCACAALDGRGQLGCLRLNDMEEFYERIDPLDVPGGKYKEEAQAKVFSDFTYEASSEGVRIIKYIGECPRFGDYDYEMLASGFELPEEFQSLPDFIVEVPSEIEGLPVTQLGDGGYNSGAFRNCVGITEVKLPESLTLINSYSFEGCFNLHHLEIPNNVTEIKKRAFRGCENLQEIEIPCHVSSIGDSAFENCKNLVRAVFQNSLIHIEDHAFSGCENLKEATLPNSLKSIGRSAFSQCKALDGIACPEQLTSLGEFAFSGTKWLSDRRAENSLVIVNGILIDGEEASGDVIIPESVKAIGNCAFYGNTKLKSVSASESLETIGSSAFMQCVGLEEVTFPKSVSSIGEEAFRYTEWLESNHRCNKLAVINSILVSAGSDYDHERYNFKRRYSDDRIIEIPEGVTFINPDAFNDLSFASWIVIPEGVTSIDRHVFRRLSCRPNIIAPSSLSSIEGGELEFEYGATIFVPADSPLLKTLGETYFRGYDLVPVEEFKACDGKTLFETLEELERVHENKRRSWN